MENTLFTKESYASFLKDRIFVNNCIERSASETFFGIIDKTDLAEDEDGKKLVDFLKSRI
jgi:hypothetical protein